MKNRKETLHSLDIIVHDGPNLKKLYFYLSKAHYQGGYTLCDEEKT